MKTQVVKYLNKHLTSNMEGKTIIITGGNSGIGFEVAKNCVYLKMKVIIACRNLSRGEEAIKQIKTEFSDAHIRLIHLDLAKFSSVHEFSNIVMNEHIIVDVFYHNAGVYKMPNTITEDGFDLTLQTNYLSVVLLDSLLKEYYLSLNRDVKIIYTTSFTTVMGKVNHDDILMNNKFKSFKMYAQTKILVAQYGKYLTDKLKDTNIKSYLVHPGATYTPLIVKGYKTPIRQIAKPVMKLVFHHPWKASLSTMYLLNNDIPVGTLIGPRGFLHLSGYPCAHNLYASKLKDIDKTISITNEMLEGK